MSSLLIMARLLSAPALRSGRSTTPLEDSWHESTISEILVIAVPGFLGSPSLAKPAPRAARARTPEIKNPVVQHNVQRMMFRSFPRIAHIGSGIQSILYHQTSSY